MTVIEYIRAKNELLHKHTGVTLVPEDQIQDCPVKRLSIATDATACPYCMAYDEHLNDNCAKCPMQLAGNGCSECHNENSTNSTYNILAKDTAITACDEPWYDELADLINEFNKSNNF